MGKADAPFTVTTWVDENGRPTRYFYQLILDLWRRTGEYNSTDDDLDAGFPPNPLVAELSNQVSALSSDFAPINVRTERDPDESFEMFPASQERDPDEQFETFDTRTPALSKRIDTLEDDMTTILLSRVAQLEQRLAEIGDTNTTSARIGRLEQQIRELECDTGPI